MYKKCLICEGDFEPLILNNFKMRRCKACGLIWQEKFDIKIDYFQKKVVELNQNKIRTKSSDSKDRIKTFKKYADLNNLCDIGCGDGIFLKTLEQEGYKNIIGIEPNSYFLKYAEENGLGVFKGTIKDFPKIIKNKNIHTLTILQMLEHLENPKESLKLIYNNIKNGDKLIIETPNIDAYSLKKTKYKHITYIHSEHLFYFNLKSIRQLLEKTGFKIIAYGKRDFDQHNLSIRRSLFKLGLSSFKDTRKIEGASGNKKTKNPFIKSFVKNIIRKTLSQIVILFGRLDLLWIVVVKKDI